MTTLETVTAALVSELQTAYTAYGSAESTLAQSPAPVVSDAANVGTYISAAQAHQAAVVVFDAAFAPIHAALVAAYQVVGQCELLLVEAATEVSTGKYGPCGLEFTRVLPDLFDPMAPGVPTTAAQCEAALTYLGASLPQ